MVISATSQQTIYAALVAKLCTNHLAVSFDSSGTNNSLPLTGWINWNGSMFSN